VDLTLRHPDFETTDVSSLRKGYYGASPMPVEVLREMQRRLPEVRLWNFDGQTEMAPIATILGPHEQLSHAGSAGRPALNVETIVVGDDGQPVPPGEIGEIVHRSPHATLGYYRDEAKTAEAFAGGWFHSGDLGVMSEDGVLSVVDRKKDMIKTGGENVASREVEEALYELEGVADVAVFAISHPRWIEAVTAAIVPKEGSALTVEDVHAHARAVQAPEVCGHHRGFAEEPEWQGRQAGPARAVHRLGRRGERSADMSTEADSERAPQRALASEERNERGGEQ
jgi:fatty-acyl-CoA synthase